jgi:hypothetical protein
MQQASANLDDHVLTPHGPVHKSCVHPITDKDDLQVFPVCPAPPKDYRQLWPRSPAGWIDSATFTPSEPLKSMSVKFTVPDPPSSGTGSLIYLFPGAQDAWGSTILQPVLQWGNNRCFGGEFWTIASWHFTSEGHSKHSAPCYPVNPGETIVGTVQMINPLLESCDWLVETKVDGDPERCTRLRVPKLKSLLLFLVAGALEGYSLPTGQPLKPTCAGSPQFPASGSTAFTSIELCDLNNNDFRADWRARYPAGVCGFKVDISDDKKAVTLWY